MKIFLSKIFSLKYSFSVDKWDESKLVFQNNALNGVEDERKEGITLQPNGMLSLVPKKVLPTDSNVNICSICFTEGKLICCDDCPSAFHALCLGYERVCWFVTDVYIAIPKRKVEVLLL